MKENYCLLAVEGQHDQAAITKMLQLSGFERFKGDHELLDPFWEDFIQSRAEQSSAKPGSRDAVLKHFGVFREDADADEQLAGIRARREATGE